MRQGNSIVSFGLLIAAGLLSCSVLAGPGAHGPNGEHLDASASTAATGLARLPDGSVNVPKEAQRRLEIRTLIAAEAQHPLTVEMNGRVGIDPNAGGQVQAPFDGRIEPGPTGLPLPGQPVTKGQVLVYVRPVAGALERGNQQAALAELRANRRLAQQRVARLESLEDTVPRKEIEAARAELAGITGRERAVAGSLSNNEAVTASATGIIAMSNVLAGQIVDARAPLFTIVDPQRMTVEALSTDLSVAGKVAAASLQGMESVKLTLAGTGRSLRDGALPLTFQARTGDAALAIGQPVTVIAKLTDQIKGIALPASAVVRNPANEPVVWIKDGLERFIAQPVQYRQLDAGTVVVTKGLPPDNRVVVSGAALLSQIR